MRISDWSSDVCSSDLILPRQDARQEMRLLLGRAESVDDRTDHRETKGHQADAVGARGLFRPDETLRRGPAGATIFDRPRGRDPALFVENFMPGEEILLGDRKSTRLNSVTNAHIVCRILLEKK